MGLADLHALIPVLAAAGEKSKTPFYVAGGVLAAWAVLVSVVGVKRPGFPGGTNGERGVIGVSVLLVALTITMAVVTASKPPHENVAQAKPLPIPPPPGVEPAPGAQAPPAAQAPAAAKPPSGAAPSGPAQTLAIAADPSGQLAYDKKSLAAKAGAVKIDFTNSSPTPHNVTIQQGSKNITATATVTQSNASVTAQLKPGTYTFYCSVDAHRQAGMVGTLKVS
jgi:plastocyanin